MKHSPLVAVVGNPNAGKSALFNALTGARQKVGNYPGVTVERHVGRLTLDDGRPIELVDLPGAYGLDPTSPDEAVTRDVLLGKQQGERLPDALLIVVDASNLDNHLRFTLQLIDLGLPTVVALNMVDLATRDGLELDAGKTVGGARRPGDRDRRGAQARARRDPRPARRAAPLPAHHPRRRRPDPRSADAPAPRARYRGRGDHSRNPGAAHDASPRRRSCSTRSPAR